jgi:hypothetical protein
MIMDDVYRLPRHIRDYFENQRLKLKSDIQLLGK